jgi:hypothetical protein
MIIIYFLSRSFADPVQALNYMGIVSYFRARLRFRVGTDVGSSMLWSSSVIWSSLFNSDSSNTSKSGLWVMAGRVGGTIVLGVESTQVSLSSLSVSSSVRFGVSRMGYRREECGRFSLDLHILIQFILITFSLDELILIRYVNSAG